MKTSIALTFLLLVVAPAQAQEVGKGPSFHRFLSQHKHAKLPNGQMLPQHHRLNRRSMEFGSKLLGVAGNTGGAVGSFGLTGLAAAGTILTKSATGVLSGPALVGVFAACVLGYTAHAKENIRAAREAQLKARGLTLTAAKSAQIEEPVLYALTQHKLAATGTKRESLQLAAEQKAQQHFEKRDVAKRKAAQGNGLKKIAAKTVARWHDFKGQSSLVTAWRHKNAKDSLRGVAEQMK